MSLDNNFIFLETVGIICKGTMKDVQLVTDFISSQLLYKTHKYIITNTTLELLHQVLSILKLMILMNIYCLFSVYRDRHV